MNYIKGAIIGLGALGGVVFVLFLVCFGGICLHYDITTIQAFIHHPISHGFVFWLLCIILGWCVSYFSIPVAIILFIVGFFT